MSDVPLYKVPMTLKRGMQWATKCADCGKEVRMGPGSKAAMLRLIDAVGRKCNECRDGSAVGVVKPTGEEPR